MDTLGSSTALPPVAVAGKERAEGERGGDVLLGMEKKENECWEGANSTSFGDVKRSLATAPTVRSNSIPCSQFKRARFIPRQNSQTILFLLMIYHSI